MRRQSGQVVALFALGLPVLLGLLGLAVDGGYYFAMRRATQFAADAAARGAATEVRRAQQGALLAYLSATNTGRRTGLTNLAGLRLSNTDVEIAYNNTVGALSISLGWSTGLPTLLTRSVRARVTARYDTLFMRLVGISSLDLEVAGTQPLAVVSISPGVLPLAVCQTTAVGQPLGPWTLWQSGANLCGIAGWDGLANLDGSARACADYQHWIQPSPPSGPSPSDGDRISLDPRDCPLIPLWMQTYNLTLQSIPEVDPSSGNTVLGCRLVLLMVNVLGRTVRGLPVGVRLPCGGILQIE
jgi:Flp pilus assembly protein TadG